MNRPTQEQREVVNSIDIPQFMNEPRDIDLDEMTMAILNNVPGNVEVEEMNHLNELEQVASNWKDAEWIRVLFKAPHKLMFDELLRRMSAYKECREAISDADQIMKNINL